MQKVYSLRVTSTNTRLLFLLCVCYAFVRVDLFIVALWSTDGKGLTSWLSFVMPNCEFVTFSLVSCVR